MRGALDAAEGLFSGDSGQQTPQRPQQHQHPWDSELGGGGGGSSHGGGGRDGRGGRGRGACGGSFGAPLPCGDGDGPFDGSQAERLAFADDGPFGRLQSTFGFQADSVHNQRESVVLLLANQIVRARATRGRLGPRASPSSSSSSSDFPASASSFSSTAAAAAAQQQQQQQQQRASWSHAAGSRPSSSAAAGSGGWSGGGTGRAAELAPAALKR
jgi:hypothetical protein